MHSPGNILENTFNISEMYYAVRQQPTGHPINACQSQYSSLHTRVK